MRQARAPSRTWSVHRNEPPEKLVQALHRLVDAFLHTGGDRRVPILDRLVDGGG